MLLKNSCKYKDGHVLVILSLQVSTKDYVAQELLLFVYCKGPLVPYKNFQNTYNTLKTWRILPNQIQVKKKKLLELDRHKIGITYMPL